MVSANLLHIQDLKCHPGTGGTFVFLIPNRCDDAAELEVSMFE